MIGWQWNKIEETSKSFRSDSTIRSPAPKLRNSLSLNASSVRFVLIRVVTSVYIISKDLHTPELTENIVIIVALIRTRVTDDGS